MKHLATHHGRLITSHRPFMIFDAIIASARSVKRNINLLSVSPLVDEMLQDGLFDVTLLRVDIAQTFAHQELLPSLLIDILLLGD